MLAHHLPPVLEAKEGCFEALMTADRLAVRFGEAVPVIPAATRLDRATASAGPRVEVEHGDPPAEVGESDRVPRPVGEFDVRGRGAQVSLNVDSIEGTQAAFAGVRSRAACRGSARAPRG